MNAQLQLFFLTFLFFSLSHSFGQIPDESCPEVIWKKSFGGTSDDSVRDMIELSDGNYAFLGRTHSQDVHLEGNTLEGQHPWVLKMDRDGHVIWSRSIGATEKRMVAFQLTEAADGGILICGGGELSGGGINQDSYVVKLDYNGQVEWTKSYNLIPDNLDDVFCYTYEYFTSINQDPAGGYVLTGYSADIWTCTDLQNKSHLVKIDETGNIVWHRIYRYPLGNWLYDEVQNGIDDIIKVAEGGFLTIGKCEVPQLGTGNVNTLWIMRLDGMGEIIWQKTLPRDHMVFGHVVEQAEDGDFVIILQELDSTNSITLDQFHVLKIDGLGDIVWEKKLDYPGLELSRVANLIKSPWGGYFVAGTVVNFSDASQDNYAVFYMDENGEIEWQKDFGGTNEDRGTSILFTSDQHLIVGGSSKSSDGDVTDHIEERDGWILKLRAYPDYTLTTDTTVCDLSASLTVRGENLEALWNGDVSNLIYEAPDTGLYHVTVFENICQKEDSVQVDIIDFSALDIGHDTSICSPDVLLLDAEMPVEASYVWQDGTVGPVYEVNRPGQYMVSVTIDHCTETRSIQIDWCESCLEVPNVFSPNNDGVNDVFRPLPACPIETISYQVYNRWGEVVFSSSDYQAGWDGRINGKEAPIDVYVYLISYKAFGEEGYKIEKGDLTLIR